MTRLLDADETAAYLAGHATFEGAVETEEGVSIPTYAATINTPGYLPEADEVATFDSISEAWSYLLDERKRDEESSSCDETCEDGPACPWSYCADMSDTVTDLEANTGTDAEVGTVCGDTPGSHSEHDLGKVYTVELDFDMLDPTSL